MDGWMELCPRITYDCFLESVTTDNLGIFKSSHTQSQLPQLSVHTANDSLQHSVRTLYLCCAPWLLTLTIPHPPLVLLHLAHLLAQSLHTSAASVIQTVGLHTIHRFSTSVSCSNCSMQTFPKHDGHQHPSGNIHTVVSIPQLLLVWWW